MFDLPVYELLGGKCHERLPAFATGGPANWPIEELLGKIDFYMSLGFRAFKVAAGYFEVDNLDYPKIKLTAASTASAIAAFEARKAAAMRQHVGPDVRILLDGHMGTSHGAETWDVGTAKAVLSAVETYDIFFFEEPLLYSVERWPACAGLWAWKFGQWGVARLGHACFVMPRPAPEIPRVSCHIDTLTRARWSSSYLPSTI